MDIWPRDALAFYEAPVEVDGIAVALVPVPLCPVDPDRRILIFSGNGLAQAQVGTNPILPGAGGLALTVNAPVLILTWEQHGALVTQAWFGVSQAGSSITVITQAIRKDPRDYGYGAAYLNPSPIPERGAPAPPRQRRALPRSVAHRSGLYSRFARSNPDLWE